jgi:hypothetical protein
MKSVLGPLIVLALAFGSGAEAGSKPPAPAEVARQFYEMASQGKCDEAERLFTAEAVRTINDKLGAPDGFRRFCEGRAGRTPIAKLTVRKEEKKGDRAQVMIERAYANGAMAVENDDLVKVGGEWKLSLGAPPAGDKKQ